MQTFSTGTPLMGVSNAGGCVKIAILNNHWWTGGPIALSPPVIAENRDFCNQTSMLSAINYPTFDRRKLLITLCV